MPGNGRARLCLGSKQNNKRIRLYIHNPYSRKIVFLYFGDKTLIITLLKYIIFREGNNIISGQNNFVP